MEKFLLRTRNICNYRHLLKHIMNRSYSLNSVCPKLFQISEYFEKSTFSFRGFTVLFALCVLGNFALFFYQVYRLLLFKINVFKKILSGIPSECQSNSLDPNQTRILSALILVKAI